MQSITEAGDNTKVATAAANGPEEVRIRVGIDVANLSIRRHQLGRQQIVDGQAIFSGQKANPTAQRDPANPDRAGVAKADRQTISRRRREDFAGR